MCNNLNQLLNNIRQCRVCCDLPEGAALPHEPRPIVRASAKARVCICGQAPGTRVQASGIPFTDPSGDRLRDWMGITEVDFYDVSKLAIVPMGFCFPGLNSKGGDLPPRRECARLWHENLFASLPNLKLVVVIGIYAQKWHLGSHNKATLTETVRNWRQYLELNPDLAYLPLPHPSWRNNGWLKRNSWFETEILPFLKKEISRLC